MAQCIWYMIEKIVRILVFFGSFLKQIG